MIGTAGSGSAGPLPHPLVAARLSAEHAIGVRHGCFCAHPYLVRLLGLSNEETARYRHDIVIGDRRNIPGAVRASVSISTTEADVDRFLDALDRVISGPRRRCATDRTRPRATTGPSPDAPNRSAGSAHFALRSVM